MTKSPQGGVTIAQTLRYAEELRDLYGQERAHRRRTEEALRLLERSYRSTVLALSTALDLRDDRTGRHAERVTSLALDLARAVASNLADDPKLGYGFLLHDVGKIGVPDGILLKAGPLTPSETATMRTHPVLGERIVAQVPHLAGTASEVVSSHHERWDGAGYTRGLAGERIPLAARLFALADAWDAMTTDRPYRRAMPRGWARREVERGAGTQFDPELVEPFLSLVADEGTA